MRQGGDVIGVMEPSKRTFPSRNMSTNEAALMARGVGQLYLSLGDTNDDGSIAVRLYYKPLVLLIWLGAVVMFFGGALSLSDRRLRVGAPKPAAGQARDAAGGVSHAMPASHGSLCLYGSRRATVGAGGAKFYRSSARARASVRRRRMLGGARDCRANLRCMVCQNQSIDDSEAPLARDLRLLVRERLKAGDSDAQVIDFLVARYGEFVLLKPRFELHTSLLWGLPPVVLVAGMRGFFVVARRRPAANPCGRPALTRPNSSGLRLWSSPAD